MICEATVEIERPIDEVFEVATCMRRCVVWVSPMSNSQIDSNESAHVGSTFSGTHHFLGQTHQSKGTITELDPPHRLTFKSLSDSGLTGRYTFAPSERGTTFRMALEFKGGQPMPWAEDPAVLKTAMESSIQQGLKQLKVLMENDVDLWTLTPPLPST